MVLPKLSESRAKLDANSGKCGDKLVATKKAMEVMKESGHIKPEIQETTEEDYRYIFKVLSNKRRYTVSINKEDCDFDIKKKT